MADYIWSCLDCGTDLDPTEAGIFWCPACERTAVPPPPDYQHPEDDDE